MLLRCLEAPRVDKTRWSVFYTEAGRRAPHVVSKAPNVFYKPVFFIKLCVTQIITHAHVVYPIRPFPKEI